MKSGDDLNMPKCILWPQLPKNPHQFVKSIYQDVSIAFCDEISMVGSSKFTKMNYQLQDIMGNNLFMGGLSFVPIRDVMVMSSKETVLMAVQEASL